MPRPAREDKDSDSLISILSESEFKAARIKQLDQEMKNLQGEIEALKEWQIEYTRPVSADAFILTRDSPEGMKTRGDIRRIVSQCEEKKIHKGLLIREREKEKAELLEPKKLQQAYSAYKADCMERIKQAQEDLLRGPIVLSRIVQQLETERDRLMQKYGIQMTVISEKEKQFELLSGSSVHRLDKRNKALNIIREINKTIDKLKGNGETLPYAVALDEMKALNKLVEGTSKARLMGDTRKKSDSSKNINDIYLYLLYQRAWKVAPAKLPTLKSG